MAAAQSALVVPPLPEHLNVWSLPGCLASCTPWFILIDDRVGDVLDNGDGEHLPKRRSARVITRFAEEVMHISSHKVYEDV